MSNPAQLSEYRRTFLGSCLGIGLKERGQGDNHVCIVILTEDDENWFVSRSGSFSSYWLPDLEEQIAAAKLWMEQNCTKDEWGYNFKP